MKDIKENVKFLGCKVNQVESDNIAKILFKYNLDNIFVINTCTLTKKADSKSKNLINKLIKTKLKNNFLIITGCMVERLFESLYKEFIKKNNFQNVIFVKNQDKEKINIFLEKTFKLKAFLGNEYILELEKIIKENKNIYSIINEIDKIIKFEKIQDLKINNTFYKNKTRSFLKIQDGCDSFCNYCIVPFVRNKLYSLPFKNIQDEIKNIINFEYKEVVLTGIRIGLYKDIVDGKILKLEDIVRYISNFNEIPRIRISSIEPTEITDELLDIFSDNLSKNKNLCEHFHIPIQSGDDEILKKMNRKYNTEYLHRLFSKIRNSIPNVRITIDLIVGFLGEKDENFHNTLKFLEENKIDGIHIFPFSVREGTFAEKMIKNDKSLLVSPNVMEYRKNILFDFNEKINKDSLNKFMNKNFEVLLEDFTKDKNYFSGYTKNYIKVLVSKNLLKSFPNNGLIFNAKLKHIDVNEKKQFFFRIDE